MASMISRVGTIFNAVWAEAEHYHSLGSGGGLGQGLNEVETKDTTDLDKIETLGGKKEYEGIEGDSNRSHSNNSTSRRNIEETNFIRSTKPFPQDDVMGMGSGGLKQWIDEEIQVWESVVQQLKEARNLLR